MRSAISPTRFGGGCGTSSGPANAYLTSLLRRITEGSAEFRQRFCQDDEPKLDPFLVDQLVRHRYTHHTRELLRLLRVALASSPGSYLALTRELLQELREPGSSATTGPSEPPPAGRPLPTRNEIAVVHRDLGGNVSHAAERLGLSRDRLRRLRATHGLRGGR